MISAKRKRLIAIEWSRFEESERKAYAMLIQGVKSYFPTELEPTDLECVLPIIAPDPSGDMLPWSSGCEFQMLYWDLKQRTSRTSKQTGPNPSPVWLSKASRQQIHSMYQRRGIELSDEDASVTAMRLFHLSCLLRKAKGAAR